MKYKFLYAGLLILSISIHVNAQSVSPIDEDYLNSLPEEVRNDILQEMSQSKDEEQKILKVPSSSISSLETVKRWEQFLKNERIDKSERFGMKLFRSMQSTFMPVNVPNMSSKYILDSGDVIEVQIVGSKEKIYSMSISRDGSISAEGVGKIYIGGKSLEEASSIITNKFKSSIIGIDVFVTLTSLRDIQVLITGFSKFPGLYTLSGNANILNALNVSGGISDEGSFRIIDIKRDGKVIESVDLYESLVFGNIDFKEVLRTGDSIYIHPAQKLVRSGNGFKNVGVFELKEGETYESFINYTGGLSRNVSSNNISLNTISNGKYTSRNIQLEELKDILPKNNDSLYAVEESYGTIKISGEVMNPGTYAISSDENIASLIKRAGGYKDNAYPFGGVLLRESAKEIEKQNNQRLYNNFIKYIASSISKGSGGQIGTSLPTVLNELKNTEVVGRVQAEFDMVRLQDNPSSDIYLTDKDEIIIPKYQPIVFVYGEVKNPGGMRYSSNLSTKDYVTQAGGVTYYGNNNSIIVVDPSGAAKIFNNRNFEFNLNNSIDIYPGSLIYVARDIDKVAGLEFTAASASIFSSLALALASLNSIN
tara:strand:- start:3030 stop:4808 length:1779 start_codon:yes stop_codon:yes gene_type:complete